MDHPSTSLAIWAVLQYYYKFCHHLDVEGSTKPDISSECVSEQNTSASESLSNSNHVPLYVLSESRYGLTGNSSPSGEEPH